MELNTLTRKTPRKRSVQVGRGGKRGKTSGRGTKGQNARAGRKKRPELRDIIKKLPKRRGYGKNRAATAVPRSAAQAVNVGALSIFAKDTVVTPIVLRDAGLIRGSVISRGGAKILSTGEITVALRIEGCKVSDAAKAKIEAAGGTIA